MRIYINADRFERMDFYGDVPEIGELCTLVKNENILTGENWYTFSPADGAGGNMDHKIKRYHGWRGTTSNIAAYAYGQRRVEAVGQFKNGNWYVSLSKDLKPDED